MIDKSFIDVLEGKCILHGYVPKNKNGEVIGGSGVTVSTGFDIGAQSIAGLNKYFKDYPEIYEKLKPYVWLKGKDAVKKLKEVPLTITEEEADVIDRVVHEHHSDVLSNIWNMYSITKFDMLPDAFQTVLYSLAYNFGPNLRSSLPQTFNIAVKAAESNNHVRLANWLEVFPSKNKELIGRRKKEAAYLRENLMSFHTKTK